MSQTAYQLDFNAANDGQLVDRLNSKTDSLPAAHNDLPMGRLVYRTSSGEARLPNLTSVTLVLDADLVASNVLAGNIVVVDTDGNATTTAYTETYASSHLATMTALAVELDAIAGIASATVGGASNRTITVVPEDGYSVYFASGAVTAGSSQAGVTLAATEGGTFWGAAYLTEREPDSTGNTDYQDLEMVSVATRGDVWIRSDAQLTRTSSVFVRVYPESGTYQKRGHLTSAAGSGPIKAVQLSGVQVIEPCSANGLALVRFNNP